VASIEVVLTFAQATESAFEFAWPDTELGDEDGFGVRVLDDRGGEFGTAAEGGWVGGAVELMEL
jgi:hypothetical protein